jgi:hypothetical protein
MFSLSISIQLQSYNCSNLNSEINFRLHRVQKDRLIYAAETAST